MHTNSIYPPHKLSFLIMLLFCVNVSLCLPLYCWVLSSASNVDAPFHFVLSIKVLYELFQQCQTSILNEAYFNCTVDTVIYIVWITSFSLCSLSNAVTVAWVSLRTTVLWGQSSVGTAWPSCPSLETSRPAALTCYSRRQVSWTSLTQQVGQNKQDLETNNRSIIEPAW